jgi:ribonuclease Z
VSGRELIVLGTASQAPTRERNHNGYALRWDDEVLLFDPGEGTQRQMTHAGVSAPQLNRICITHFHGDHCLGLPGVIQRLSLDRVEGPVDIYFPAGGARFFERLRHAAETDEYTRLAPHPCGPGVVARTPTFTLSAARLDHPVETLGWRLTEPDGRTMLPDRLDAAGIHGPDVGRLREQGHLDVDGRRVTLEEMSQVRAGQTFAFVMDTRLCDAVLELADGADLLVCESTFLDSDADLAHAYGHLTAAEAGRVAAEAGVRRLVLTHFSQRYPDAEAFGREARAAFDDVVVARDLMRVEVPARRTS